MVSNTRLHMLRTTKEEEGKRQKKTKLEGNGEKREMVKIKEKQEDKTSGRSRTKRKKTRRTDEEFNTEDMKEVLGSNDTRLH